MVSLGLIAFQDFKERQVYWFYFPLIALLFALLHFNLTANWGVFLYEIAINWVLVTCIISILYTYTKLVSKKEFLGHSIGLGDVLFFYAFATGFPSISFMTLMVSAILFSLFTFLILKHRMKLKTVPLAGLMGLFLIFIVCYSLVFNNTLLYGI
ncbi:MAG: hypothetical protein VXW38_11445 [Bacteroidota bacterium]|nr:hypothetical protein [Bacteroidota bacterium]